MKKIILSLVILSSCLLTGFSQQQAYIGGRLEYGSFMRSYAAGRTALRNPSIGSVMNIGFQGQYRLFDALTIEAGATLKRYQWKLRDQNFAERHPGFVLKAKSVVTMPSLFTSLQYAFELDKNVYLYTQVGIDYDYVKEESLTEEKVFERGNDEITITSNFISRNLNVVPEIGVQWRDFYDGMWSVGLSYHNAMNDSYMQTIDYKIVNKFTSVIEDQGFMKGSYVGLDVKYNFMFFEKKKRVKKTPEPDVVEEEVDVFEELPDNTVVTDEKINDRDLVIEHKIKVKKPTVKIMVYDHQIVDGDIISLFLNDELILEEYTLIKEKNVITVTLPEGDNKLILYAHNLGKYKPNTAGLVVDDGTGKPQTLILKSDLNESGVLIIKYKP